jgi:hypothetical protein
MERVRISNSFLFAKILATILFLGFIGIQVVYLAIKPLVIGAVIYGLFWLYAYFAPTNVEFDSSNLYVKERGGDLITIDLSVVQGIYNIAGPARSNQGKMTISYIQAGKLRKVKFSPRILTGALDDFRELVKVKNPNAEIDMCWPYS